MKDYAIRRFAISLVLITMFSASVLPAVAAEEKSAATLEGLIDVHQDLASTQKTIGVLIFPGFELLDAYGPMEMWGSLKYMSPKVWGGEDKRVSVRVVIIADRRGEVVSNQGPKTVADYSYGDAPHLDYLLVPGGIVHALLKDKATLEWLRERAGQAELVMSVCNGSSILAAAGILDNRKATTNKMFWKESTAPGPKTTWIKKARWVDDGNVVTSSGVSAGMDMTVAVFNRLFGADVADLTEQLAEYEAHRDQGWDPFAVRARLAD